jgi:hypothetical protein
MPVRVPLQHVAEHLRLAKPVTDPDGRVIAGVGTALDARVQKLLRRLAIQTVVVDDDDGIAAWAAVRPLAEDLQALEGRFADERDVALGQLHDAIARRLARRAERHGEEVDG